MGLLAILQAAQQLSQPRGIAMPGISLEPQTPNYAPSQVDVDRRLLLDILANPPQMQAPVEQVQPALRTPDAVGLGLAGLAALIGGRGGREFAEGVGGTWGQGKMQKAQYDTQAKQRQADFNNQRTLSDYNSRVNVAKTKLDFTEEDDKRAYSEKQRAVAAADKSDLERMKAELKIKQDAAKADRLDRREGLKGLMRKMSPEAREAFAQRFWNDSDLAEAFGELTVEETHKQAQTKNVEAKTETEKATLQKKLRKFDDEHLKTEQYIKQSNETIKKWYRDYGLAKRRTASGEAKQTLDREKFEWSKRNKAGVSAADKKLADLQRKKQGLIAEAETWKEQLGNIPGMIERQTPQSTQALAKIQRQIESIDAQINSLREIGGSDSVDSLRKAAEEAIRLRPDKADFIRKSFKRDTGFDL